MFEDFGWHEIFLESVHIGIFRAPPFLFFGSLFLVFLTVFSSAMLFAESEAVIRTLKKLYKKIGEVEPRGDLLGSDGLKKLADIMEEEPLVKFQWNEFHKTLIIETPSTSNVVSRVYSTTLADNFFTQEAIINTQVNLKFYLAVPSILTSSGLMLTFLAILIGLSEINVDGEQIRGVGNLVNNLSGKFISSISALFCALCFTIVEKNRTNVIHRVLKAFTEILDSRFARKSAEHLLIDLKKDINEQKAVLKLFGSYMADILKTSFREGTEPTFAKVNEVLTKLHHEIDRLADNISDQRGEPPPGNGAR